MFANKLGEAQYAENPQMATGFDPRQLPGNIQEALVQPDDLIGSGLLKAAMIPLKKAPFIGFRDQAYQPLLKLFRGEYDHLGGGIRKKALASEGGTTFTSPHRGTAISYGQGNLGFKSGKNSPHQLYEIDADVSKIFDYENPKHIARLRKLAKEHSEEADYFMRKKGKAIEKGDWFVIEKPQIQELLRKDGFSGISVFEDGVKNIGFFTDKNPIIPNPSLGNI
jgi:hypothetical protein